jgi:2-oxo-4-hydroxy-4-carboxy-5-ureidoimidazoline decarboxylase
MLEQRPFEDETELLAAASRLWNQLGPDDWKEAFSHHPKIGDINSLRKTFAATSAWAEGEQSGVHGASEETLGMLAESNAEYERRFGYIYIVCATGKSAGEMLALLVERLKNNPETELSVAATEQLKIIHIRLEKLLS